MCVAFPLGLVGCVVAHDAWKCLVYFLMHASSQCESRSVVKTKDNKSWWLTLQLCHRRGWPRASECMCEVCEKSCEAVDNGALDVFSE